MENFLWACYVALQLLPEILCPYFSSKLQGNNFGIKSRYDFTVSSLYGNSRTLNKIFIIGFLANVLGAFAFPLDWNKPWQKFPISLISSLWGLKFCFCIFELLKE